MSFEALQEDLLKIEQQLNDSGRQSLLGELSSRATPRDRRRDQVNRGTGEESTLWCALENIASAEGNYETVDNHEEIEGQQACFVKDLEFYLQDQKAPFRAFISLVFDVGTSSYWYTNPDLVSELNRICYNFQLERGAIE